MVKRWLTVGGLIGHLAAFRVSTKKRFEINPDSFLFFPHAISFWNLIPGSLLPHFKCGQDRLPCPSAPSLSHLAIQRCAQFPNNSCTSAVGTKSFPAPASNAVCSCNSVRSLLRQPRSALEAGPSEAHAISFVRTPRPHLHSKDCTFSIFCPSKGIMGKILIGLKRHPFSGPVDSVGELLHTP